MIAEAPGEVEPKMLLLGALASMGETEEALALMQDILVLDPLNAEVLVKVAYAYIEMEDWDNARETLNRSLKMDPDQPTKYQALAIIDQNTGDGVGFVSNYLMAIKADPQDHGYAARLANFLYSLGLQQQGDRFRDRSIAIAPTSAHARRMELVREVRFGTRENSLALARQMIEDGVDRHSGAWQEAAYELFAISEKLGQSEEALDFAERQLPGFANFAQPAPPKIIIARLYALPVYYGGESHEDLQRRLDHLEYVFDNVDEIHSMVVLALRGDTQGAIDVALTDVLNKPAIRHIKHIYFTFDLRIFDLQFMAEVAADPRVQQALARWREGREKAAEEVRDYLAGVEAK